MHDQDADGNDFFKCDFCLQPWSEDRPMVEGHRGSLLCGPCLSMAYRFAILTDPPSGPMGDQGSCALCLQHKDKAAWESPLAPATWACAECITNAAKMLSKDPEINWKAPT
jgi:hypothetical protein